MKTLLQRLYEYALNTPDAIAIRSQGSVMTYTELLSEATRVAKDLLHYEVKSLGLYLDNGFEWIVADLAGMIADIRVVPLPWFFSGEQLTHACTNAHIDHVIADSINPIANGTSVSLYGSCNLFPVVMSGFDREPLNIKGGKVSFTSGTTGTPKGIQLEYGFIQQTCCSISEVIADLDIDRHLSVLPYSTLLENIAGIYVPLYNGRTIHAEPSSRTGLSASLELDSKILEQTFNEIRPASMILTPQLLEVFCLLSENARINTESLAFVAVGGARVTPSLIERARKAGIPAYEGYGLTEFGSVALLNTPACDRIGSVGKVLPGVSLEIADDGEICLSTTFDELIEGITKARTVYVKTGDFGEVDSDGFVYVHGRKSNVIVLSTGRNVSPEWVEAELNASSLIHQSYVFGESSASLSALVVPATDTVSKTMLNAEIERINQTLPAYARIRNSYPLHQPFSTSNHMLTPNGRLKRVNIEKALPELLNSTTCTRSAPHRTPNSTLQETSSC
jgi:long-subunit acyl-CoA synthetase (AMP-forming)